MSTCLHDLHAQTVCGVSVPPTYRTDGENGVAVDLIHGDGPGFATLLLGDATAGSATTGHVEESADNATWAAITGATFPSLTAANAVATISFARSKRYVRAVLAISGSNPEVATAVIVGQQQKSA